MGRMGHHNNNGARKDTEPTDSRKAKKACRHEGWEKNAKHKTERQNK